MRLSTVTWGNRSVRRAASNGPKIRTADRFRRLLCEPLEDRQMLSIGAELVALPGMYLADPSADRFAGQIVYLDFDGARDVTYNGPVVIEGIDVPSFRLPGALAGREGIIIDGLVQHIEGAFGACGISFTTQPPAAGEYSTVYIGGDGSAFTQYGSYFGLAEQTDAGNSDHGDSAFVFSDLVLSGGNVGTLVDVTVHEIGHLLGYAHDRDDAGSESDLASVAHKVDTHVVMASHACNLYKALFGVADVELDYEDHITDDHTADADTGRSICDGVEEEDETFDQTPRWLRHFCQGGDDNELFVGLSAAPDNSRDTPYENAVYYAAAAQDRFTGTEAVTQHQPMAYWWLGRTMHLLQDSTVPAHVHRDEHVVCDDEYEERAYGNRVYFRFDTRVNGTSWAFQDWADGSWSLSSESLTSSPRELWDRVDYYGHSGLGSYLENLFRETTDYTDDYDSDDEDGDYHNSTAGDGFPTERFDEMVGRSTHTSWASTVRRNDGWPCGELSSSEVEKLARDLGTWAVEQSAILMRAFYGWVGEIVSVPGDIQIDATGSDGVELSWQMVDNADGYVVYRSTAPDAGFEVTPLGNGYDDSGRWRWQDANLLPDTDYYYRVYAYNNVAGLGHGYTSVAATTDPDVTPPTPNPSSWSLEPYATGNTSIGMVATTVGDPSGVEYYFAEMSGNPSGNDSGWQDSPVYEDTDLSPNTTYIYQVMTRDKSPNQNTGDYSVASSATTLAEETLVVSTLADEDNAGYGPGDLSLREGLGLANGDPDKDEIHFAPHLAGGTMGLSLGELQITSNLDLLGSGVTIDAGGKSRVFVVPDAETVSTLHDLTITSGSSSTGSGGGILNQGTLGLVNSTISDSFAGLHGGGICNSSTGVLVVENSTISGNSANGHGGGIHNEGTLSVDHSTIDDNIADVNDGGDRGRGGGIFNSGTGTLWVGNSTISRNRTPYIAGGINVQLNGHATVVNSTISGNEANSVGGGFTTTARFPCSTRQSPRTLPTRVTMEAPVVVSIPLLAAPPRFTTRSWPGTLGAPLVHSPMTCTATSIRLVRAT